MKELFKELIIDFHASTIPLSSKKGYNSASVA